MYNKNPLAEVDFPGGIKVVDAFQASQALNLCAATIEFSGSTEQAEGERLLLLASKYPSYNHWHCLTGLYYNMDFLLLFEKQ